MDDDDDEQKKHQKKEENPQKQFKKQRNETNLHPPSFLSSHFSTPKEKATLPKKKKTSADHGTVIKCSHCCGRYKDKQSYSLHLNRAHPKEEKQRLNQLQSGSPPPPTCLICGKSFSVISSLNRHNRLKHSLDSDRQETEKSGSPPTCLICDTTFSTISSLTRHHKRKHLLDRTETEENGMVFGCR